MNPREADPIFSDQAYELVHSGGASCRFYKGVLSKRTEAFILAEALDLFEQFVASDPNAVQGKQYEWFGPPREGEGWFTQVN